MKAKDVRNVAEFLTYLDQVGAIYEAEGTICLGRQNYFIYDKNWYDPNYKEIMPFLFGDKHWKFPNIRVSVPMYEDFDKTHIHERVRDENGELTWVRYFQDVSIETICKKIWKMSRKRKTA